MTHTQTNKLPTLADLKAVAADEDKDEILCVRKGEPFNINDPKQKVYIYLYHSARIYTPIRIHIILQNSSTPYELYDGPLPEPQGELTWEKDADGDPLPIKVTRSDKK